MSERTECPACGGGMYVGDVHYCDPNEVVSHGLAERVEKLEAETKTLHADREVEQTNTALREEVIETQRRVINLSNTRIDQLLAQLEEGRAATASVRVEDLIEAANRDPDPTRPRCQSCTWTGNPAAIRLAFQCPECGGEIKYTKDSDE